MNIHIYYLNVRFSEKERMYILANKKKKHRWKTVCKVRGKLFSSKLLFGKKNSQQSNQNYAAQC
jgi:hypothetical protein